MRAYVFYILILFFVTGGFVQGQNVFRYEYDLGSSGSGYDSGEGGGGYKSSDGTFFICGRTDVSGDDDPFLLKINTDGTKNFVKQYRIQGAGPSWDYISQGKVTADGGYILYGTTDYNNTGDILLIKTNNVGTLSWVREINLSGVPSLSTGKLFEKSGGGYLLSGTINGGGAGLSDVFVVSISADGNTTNFAKSYGTTTYEHGNSIVENSSTGNIAFVGDIGTTSKFDGWWCELNSTGTAVNYSKSLGESGFKNEQFNDIIQTTANNYFVVGNFCGGLSACSAYFTEFSSTTGGTSNKKYFTTNPTGTVFSIDNVYRTPDNNNYWLGGVYINGGTDNDCLMLKTSTATPGPSTGYVIGDSDEQAFYYSSGAACGNDEFILGGTENRTPNGFAEWRPTLIKQQSALQCNSSTISFSASNYATAAANVTTTITNLTATTYTLIINTDITTITPSLTAIQSCLTSLPVSLLSFSGRSENNSVRLSWTTASEENNNYFTIERSSDGNAFNEIGNVNGAGNSSTLKHYDFTDETPQLKNYYRLSQIDFNGQKAALGIVAVNFDAEGSGLSVLIQSNPVANGVLSLNIFSPSEGEVLLQITDLQGTQVHAEKINLLKNESSLVSIDLKDVSKGIYLISGIGKTGVVNRKFLLLNRD